MLRTQRLGLVAVKARPESSRHESTRSRCSLFPLTLSLPVCTDATPPSWCDCSAAFAKAKAMKREFGRRYKRRKHWWQLEDVRSRGKGQSEGQIGSWPAAKLVSRSVKIALGQIQLRCWRAGRVSVSYVFSTNTSTCTTTLVKGYQGYGWTQVKGQEGEGMTQQTTYTSTHQDVCIFIRYLSHLYFLFI